MPPKLPTSLPPHITFKYLKSCIGFGDLHSARKLFDKIPNPDLHALTILISAYTKQGLPRESIRLYWKLRREKNLRPERLVLLAVAKASAACSDLMEAKEIDEEVDRFGFGSDVLLGNVMIDMYGKCGFCEGARRVFDGLSEKDVISWISLIGSYVNCGLLREGLGVFGKMLSDGMKPNSVTLSTILPACSKLKALNAGREVHCYIIRSGLEYDVFVSSGLVDMYSGCSSITQARMVFDIIPQKTC